MSPDRVMQVRVVAARTQQTLGWAGIAGVVLLLVSMTWLGLAWRAHRMPLPDDVAEPVRPVVAAQTTALPLKLPSRDEVPLLLTLVQQTVVNHGLAWAAADYKLLPASETAPAALEIRCNFKGSYPQLRAALAQLLGKVPGLAIRELSMNRPNIDTPEVDAKLGLVVFLRDGPPQAEGAGLKGNP